MEYLDGLSDAELPRFVLACDFQTFLLTDLDTGEQTAFALADLHKHVQKFGFILGRQRRTFAEQAPVNVKAAELVGHLHDALEASGYKGHRLSVFLTRIVFCLFADDTGIFEPRDLLMDVLERRTAPDGSDTGRLLAELFDVLDTPEEERQTTLDADLARFPHVNGALDRAVDRLYRRRAFSGDRERVEHLFGLYERMAAPLDVKAKGKRRRRRAAS